MWSYLRDKEIKDNENLEKIDKEFSVVEKVRSVFELFFEGNGQLNIVECCDNYFIEQLSVEELKQLSQYFLKVADYIEKKNKIVDV